MKKLFIAVLAVAALASCAQDEIITKHNQVAIGFGNAYVDNSTKAIITDADDIEDFTVWGTVQGTGTTPVALYGTTGATVTRGEAALGAAWECLVDRYWTPSCIFNFAAVANATSVTAEDGLPSEISYTVNDGEPTDLIYATASAKTNENSEITVLSGAVNNNIVAFTFKHLLSKIYFDVTSSLDNAYTVEVTNIAVTGVQSAGTYTIGTTNLWVKDGANTTSLNFTNGENGAKLIIPVEQTLGVTITYDVTFGGQKISTGVTKTGTVAAFTYQEGHAYKITASIGLNRIDFTLVNLDGFTTGAEGNVQ